MHRHGYQGRKLGRERDQRKALLKSLADSLIINESIETTLPRAKELVPYLEKLITKAKVGGLHQRRQIIASLQTIGSAHKLVDEIAPATAGRTSGHLRIERTVIRRGDNAQLAKVSFVDDLKKPPVARPAKPEAKKVPKTTVKTASKPKTVKKTNGAKKS